MIDYKNFTINTNIILLFNNVFSKLFYTISFINYCNCYKLYTQCWPYQIFVHGALHAADAINAHNSHASGLHTPHEFVGVLLEARELLVAIGEIADEHRARRLVALELLVQSAQLVLAHAHLLLGALELRAARQVYSIVEKLNIM